MPTHRLAGWGRHPVVDCTVHHPTNPRRLVEGMPCGALIARGAGRSYGDASLNPEGVISTRGLNRMLHVSDAGVLTCESGVLLSEVIDTFLPRGWFPAITPGTKIVTIGGMIASDVHGKNHKAGSFADHLIAFDLALGDGSVVTCSRNENAELFAATCGGMGLTGVILRATFRLLAVETAKVRQRVTRAADLGEAIEQLGAAPETYAVGWIDCLAKGDQLGRSVLFFGEHAGLDDLPAGERGHALQRAKRKTLKMPVDLPGFALSEISLKAFNLAYFHVPRPHHALVDIDPYFYPLDAIQDWNRLYGRRGFVQYQVVLPVAESLTGLQRLLAEIAKAGSGSFLAVLKRMGEQSLGLLSFPMPGYTLALDFQATAVNFALLDRLDGISGEHGGRIYLTKDARVSAASVEAAYPRLPEFRSIRAAHGLTARFASLQSRRLNL